jgi:hypothetical protein
MAQHQTFERSDAEPAHHYQLGICGDPKCGLHLVAYRSNDQPICEVIIGRVAVLELTDFIHDQGLDL